MKTQNLFRWTLRGKFYLLLVLGSAALFLIVLEAAM